MSQTALAKRFDILKDVDIPSAFCQHVVARDRASGSSIALKIFHQAVPENEELRSRLREVLTAGSLSSPYVERVLDGGRIGDDIFISAEPLNGVLLHTVLRERTWSASEVHSVIRQIAEALSTVHGQGILHRSLNPSKIVLLPSEDAAPRLKVLDFGIAALAAATQAGRTFTYLPDITQWLHAAPEAVRDASLVPGALGKSCDARADLYSLGAIAFELISGSPPFQGTDPAVLKSILKEPPPHLTPADPNFPRMTEVDLFLQRALAKNHADRPPDAATFLREFEAALFH